MSACSGPSVFRTGGSGGGTGGTGGGIGAGNATLSVIVKDAPPAGIGVVDYGDFIGNIALDPTTGPAVHLTQSTFSFDMTRLQSDTFYLGTFTVPAQQYRDIVFFTGDGTMAFVNGTGGTIIGSSALVSCSNPLCSLQPDDFLHPILNNGAFPLSIQANQNYLLVLDFKLDNAVTLSGTNVLQVNFTAANALTPKLVGGGTNGTDVLEDFTGKVTAITGSTVTVQSGTQGTLVATANSGTIFDNFSTTVCPSPQTFAACVKVGQTISIDASVAADGTITLLEADLLDATAVDEIEGTIITTDSSTQTFFMSVTDKTIVSGNSNLTNSTPDGGLIKVALGATPAFSVDTKGLSVPAGIISNFASFSALGPGQTVRIQPTNVTFVFTGLQVTTNNIVLRFSRFTGNVTINGGGPIFSVDAASLPSYLGGIGNAQIQVFPAQTRYDGVTDNTKINSGDSVSFRALFLPNTTPQFFAAKVRDQTQLP